MRLFRAKTSSPAKSFERQIHPKVLLRPPAARSTFAEARPSTTATMISDNDLYTLAIFLGSLAMLLIVLYHFLEVNAIQEAPTKAGDQVPSKAAPQAHGRAASKS